VIILANQAINIYTPEKPDWGSYSVDCSKETYKYSCAFTNNILWKNVYGRLFFTKDITREYVTDSILDYDGPYFNDIASNFALVFGLRAGLTFLVLLWANYKPLYLFGFTRTVCNPLGCGDKEGSRATSEHVECGWSLGGLLSNWSNNQLGALRNHDWVGSLFFFIAFIVLSMGLNDNKIAGSYIPKKTVLDDYVNALSTDMKTTFKTIYGGQSGGVYTPCKASFFGAGLKTVGGTITADKVEMALLTNSDVYNQVIQASIQYDSTVTPPLTTLSIPVDSTPVTVTFPENIVLGIQTDKQLTSSTLGTNSISCANPKSTSSDDDKPSYVVGFVQVTSNGDSSVPYGTSMQLVTDAMFGDSPSTISIPHGDPGPIDSGNTYQAAYLTGDVYKTKECCNVGSADAPTKFEDSISSRFETYAILMMIGSIFWAISALAQFIAMTFYNVRARPLSLVDPDGGYSMTPA